MPAAELTFITLNSAHLGDSLAVLLCDDENKTAVHLLDTCLSLTPQRVRKVFTDAAQGVVFRAGDELKGKSVVCFEAGRLKKMLPDAPLLLSCSIVENNQPFRVKGVMGLEERKAEGPISWVLVGKGNEIVDPRVMKVHVSANAESTKELRAYRAAMAKDPSLKERMVGLESDVAKAFDRLPSKAVAIPFSDQLSDALDPSIHHIDVFEIVTRLTRIVTRVNNPPKVTREEILAAWRGQPYEAREEITPNGHEPPPKALSSGSSSQGSGAPMSQSGNVLTATKIDYCYVYWLIEGLVDLSPEPLSGEEKRVLESIRKLNKEVAKEMGATFLFGEETDEKILEFLDNNVDHWPHITLIMKEVNRGGGQTLNREKVDKALKTLVDQGKVRKEKPHGAKNKYVYVTASFTPVNSLGLPKPSSIVDQTYPTRLKVVNPFSGLVEEI
jgi:hypothetical protein